MEKKKIRFVINPKSGSGRATGITDLIRKKFPANEYDSEIILTTHAGHLKEIAKDAAEKKIHLLMVAGGDGTVHEAAGSLTGSATVLGIIPLGSGNGFANHFKIPHDPGKALDLIRSNNLLTIDTFSVNGIPAAGVAGAGFDALIAHRFSTYGKRGFSSYVMMVIKEYFSYREKEFVITAGGKTFTRSAMLVTVANTSQYGNNAVISPASDAADGLLDVCLLKKIPFLLIPFVAARLFGGSLHRSSFFETFTCSDLRISLSSPLHLHIDGEPYPEEKELIFSVRPRSLRILVP